MVGLNTSALVEAAIVDRPVFTLLLPEFRDNQEGTFHFHHLLTVGDGFLNVSRSLDEHAAQLASILAAAPVRANRPFVERFIRPRGAAVAATPVFVEAVEAMARRAAAAAAGAGRGCCCCARWCTLGAGRARARARADLLEPREAPRVGANVEAIGQGRAAPAKRRDKRGALRAGLPQQVMAWMKTVVKQALGAAGL